MVHWSCFRSLAAATTGPHPPGTTPSPPPPDTRTPIALVDCTSPSPSRSARTSGSPRSLRVPCVIRRSITTNRIACSARLFVGSTPGVVMNRK